jgi:16S rRNA (guanine(966)-N(2))-methyltransferase RsmD
VRIIGGEARSRQIDAPKGMDTRPTQDKVRESLFNILRWDLNGRIVLDLFAGSGALGLEALSRGAAYAIFVDSSAQAAKIVQSNVERLGFADRAKVIRADWKAAVSALAPNSKGGFDLIFLDPPYAMVNTGEMCNHMLKCRILANSPLVVIEHALETPPRLYADFRVTDSRRYGDTGITFCTLDTKEGAD